LLSPATSPFLIIFIFESWGLSAICTNNSSSISMIHSHHPHQFQSYTTQQ